MSGDPVSVTLPDGLDEVGIPGFEPGSTDSKSGVLPLHHIPNTPFRKTLHYITGFRETAKGRRGRLARRGSFFRPIRCIIRRMAEHTYRVETSFPVSLFTCPLDSLTDFWLDWRPFDQGPGIFCLNAGEALGVRAQGFTDADLIRLARELAPVAALRYLYLAENRNVTNRGAAAIAALPQLRYLNLSACDLNSEGLEFLPALVNLETLDLSFCNRVSGAGGKYVQQLPKLKTLLVQGTTKLNTAGLKRYEKRGLEIRTGKNS